MLEICNKTRNSKALPATSKKRFVDIADKMLPKSYELSLVICGDKLTRSLNKEHRKKDKVSNVLSFPLDKTTGEIFLNTKEAKREAARFGRSAVDHCYALFIHGIAHLKGYKHGEEMDRYEASIRKAFKVG